MSDQTTDVEMRTQLLKTKVNVEFFKTLFDRDNIITGKSITQYKNLGKKMLLNELDIDENVGINTTESNYKEKRIKNWGSNAYIETEANSIFFFIWESLQDTMLQILCLASVVSLIVGIVQEGLATGWIDGSAILLAVVIVVSITSYQNFSKEQQFNKLKKDNHEKMINVRRNSSKIQVNVDDILVGDIIYLEIGDMPCADGILIKDSVVANESAITGESIGIKKNVNFEKIGESVTPFIISGTQIEDGSGEMIVCSVGTNKYITKISESDEAEDEDDKLTPLQKKLKVVADYISSLGLIIAIFIGLVILGKEIILRLYRNQTVFTSTLVDSLIYAFIIAVIVIVVAIPEGLPMAVVISLAYSVFKMKDKNNLVKHIDSAETMGNVNNICTDKTGTLTYGKMTFHSVIIEGDTYYNSKLNCTKGTLKLFIESIRNNVSANMIKNDKGALNFTGNPTECALLQLVTEINDESKNDPNKTIFARLPFKSDTKFMATICQIEKKIFRLYVKGAPELVLEFCDFIISKKGEKVYKKNQNPDLDEDKVIFSELNKLTKTGVRAIGLAYRDIPEEVITETVIDEDYGKIFFDQLLHEMIFIGLTGFVDKPRDKVANSITECIKAGVTVRMVTGDNIRTAIYIAKEVNILSKDEANHSMNQIDHKNNNILDAFQIKKEVYAMEGSEFRQKCGGYTKTPVPNPKNPEKPEYIYKLNSKEKFEATIKNLKVMARSSPDDKFMLVLGLKVLDNIVAVTGDGTNDALALLKSDVGFSMGSGTDIAKEASDIVLLDDNFSSIIVAMEYGRNIYDCIRKFLQFQLTTNVVAVFMTLLGAIALKDAPLNAIQMLWVNLIMDSFASLALATEPPNKKLLERSPYPLKDNIINPLMIVNVISQSVFQITILTIILFFGDTIFGVPSDRELSHRVWNEVNGYHFTIFFNIFVFMQVFNSINARKLHTEEKNIFEDIFNNWLYLAVQGLIVVGQLLMVTFGGRALRTHPLSVLQHLACIGISALSLIVGFLIKFLPVDKGKNEDQKIGLSFRKSRTEKSLYSGMLSRKQN